MAAAWVKNVNQATAVASANAQTITLGTTAAAGDHLIVHAGRANAGDLIASAACSAAGAAVSVDHAGSDRDGFRHGVVSIYLPSGAGSTDTVTVTWTNAAAFNYFAMTVDEYTGLATSTWTDQKGGPANGFGTAITSGNCPATTSAGVAVGFVVIGTNVAFTPGTGFNAARDAFLAANSSDVFIVEDQAAAVSTQYAATGTAASNVGWDAILITYKQASGASLPPVATVPIAKLQAVQRAAYW